MLLATCGGGEVEAEQPRAGRRRDEARWRRALDGGAAFPLARVRRHGAGILSILVVEEAEGQVRERRKEEGRLGEKYIYLDYKKKNKYTKCHKNQEANK